MVIALDPNLIVNSNELLMSQVVSQKLFEWVEILSCCMLLGE